VFSSNVSIRVVAAGMPLNKLRVVVYSLIVSRIGYALPASGGFVSACQNCLMCSSKYDYCQE